MNSILKTLRGGDRRSIGKSNEVVAEVLKRPTLFRQVMQGLSHDDRLVRMRCADAAEKISAVRPEYLAPYGRRLLDIAATEEPELRWHIAQMLPRLSLPTEKRAQAVEILLGYARDKHGIVRTCALRALVEFAEADAALRKPVVAMLIMLRESGTAAMRTRSNRLLARLT